MQTLEGFEVVDAVPQVLKNRSRHDKLRLAVKKLPIGKALVVDVPEDKVPQVYVQTLRMALRHDRPGTVPVSVYYDRETNKIHVTRLEE